jgi:hypothetical protein
VFERNLKETRKEWMSGIRKIAAAPRGATVRIQPKDVRITESADAQSIRITDEPDAPAFRLVDPNKTHPYRMKDLVKKVNSELSEFNSKINNYDIRAIMEIHGFWDNVRYTHQPTYGTRTYSPGFVSWIKKQVQSDKYFLRKTRSAQRRKRRMQKRSNYVLA